MKICIDPGHSGPVEPGAVAGKITEADLNLALARCTGDALRTLGHEIMFTRQGDIADTGLTCRAGLANDWGADFFVSIHCNAFSSPEACGVETYHYPDSAAGRALATAIQTELAALNYTVNRGKGSPVYGAGGHNDAGGVGGMRFSLQYFRPDHLGHPGLAAADRRSHCRRDHCPE